MLRPDYIVVNDCVYGVSVVREGKKRERKRNTQGRQISRKAERGAENKDSACLGLGWAGLGLGYGQQSQGDLRVCIHRSDPAWPPASSCLCSAYSAASFCIVLYQCPPALYSLSLSSLLHPSRAVDHVSETVSMLPDSAWICTNFAKVHRKLA